MAFNYVRAAATATRLIANFGQQVTLRKRTQSGSDRNPTYTNVDSTVTVVDLDIVQSNAGTSLNEQRMRKVLMSADSTVPSTNDRVLLGNEWHTLGEVMPLNPAGTVVMYEAELID